MSKLPVVSGTVIRFDSLCKITWLPFCLIRTKPNFPRALISFFPETEGSLANRNLHNSNFTRHLDLFFPCFRHFTMWKTCQIYPTSYSEAVALIVLGVPDCPGEAGVPEEEDVLDEADVLEEADVPDEDVPLLLAVSGT
jgi:hypothetical protein